MSARSEIETVMADIINQYLPPNTGIVCYPGRPKLSQGLVTPYFIIVAKEAVEVVSGSSCYLGDLSFIVVTSSNDQLSSDQENKITAAMNSVRGISETLRSEGIIFIDKPTGIIVDGVSEMSQINVLDAQSFGDQVDLRVGFRDLDAYHFSLATATPII